MPSPAPPRASCSRRAAMRASSSASMLTPGGNDRPSGSAGSSRIRPFSSSGWSTANCATVAPPMEWPTRVKSRQPSWSTSSKASAAKGCTPKSASSGGASEAPAPRLLIAIEA